MCIEPTQQLIPTMPTNTITHVERSRSGQATCDQVMIG